MSKTGETGESRLENVTSKSSSNRRKVSRFQPVLALVLFALMLLIFSVIDLNSPTEVYWNGWVELGLGWAFYLYIGIRWLGKK